MVEKEESAVPVRGREGSKFGEEGSKEDGSMLFGLVSMEDRTGVVVPEPVPGMKE